MPAMGQPVGEHGDDGAGQDAEQAQQGPQGDIGKSRLAAR